MHVFPVTQRLLETAEFVIEQGAASAMRSVESRCIAKALQLDGCSAVGCGAATVAPWSEGICMGYETLPFSSLLRCAELMLRK